MWSHSEDGFLKTNPRDLIQPMQSYNNKRFIRLPISGFSMDNSKSEVGNVYFLLFKWYNQSLDYFCSLIPWRQHRRIHCDNPLLLEVHINLLPGWESTSNCRFWKNTSPNQDGGGGALSVMGIWLVQIAYLGIKTGSVTSLWWQIWGIGFGGY